MDDLNNEQLNQSHFGIIDDDKDDKNELFHSYSIQQIYPQRQPNIEQFGTKPSHNKDQYMNEFVNNKRFVSVQSFNDNLRDYGISYIPDLSQKIYTQLQKGDCSKNYRIFQYNVRMVSFIIKVKIFNIIQEDGFQLNFSNQISHGAYGTVFEANNPFANNQQVAIKQIKYSRYSNELIQNTVKEYAMIKLLAALQVGPSLVKIFGFDLVMTASHIFFSMEKGESLSDSVMKHFKKQNFLGQFQKLEESLILLHRINICHNDIKPQNIVFSPKLKKLVFIDFGFSEVRFQPIGYMKMCTAKGSLYYCSDEMKNIFLTTGEGFVDTYFNDYICLKKTKEYLMKNFFYDESNFSSTQNCNENQYFPKLDCKIFNFKEEINRSLTIIYIAYLIEKKDLDEFITFTKEQRWIFPFVQENLKIICNLFLQVQPSLSLWNIFLQLCDTYAPQSSLNNSEVKNLIEKTIKPYFKAFFSQKSTQKVKQIYNVDDKSLSHKMLIRYNLTNFSERQIYEIDQKNQSSTKDTFDLSEDCLQNFIPYFEKFEQLNYFKQRELAQLLITILNSKKRWSLISDSDIKLVRKCFFIIEINIKFSKLQDQLPERKFRAFMNFFAQYLFYVHKRFDVRTMFSDLIQKFYKGDNEVKKILKDFMRKGYDNCRQSNRNQNLQIYMLVVQKIVEGYQKNIAHSEYINILKRFQAIFDQKFVICLQLIDKVKQKQKQNILEPLFQALISMYFLSRYHINGRGYFIAYHNVDLQNMYYFHMKFLNLASPKNVPKYNHFLQKMYNNYVYANIVTQLIQLLTLSTLIPPTLTIKYDLVNYFKACQSKASQCLSQFESLYMRGVLFNIQLKLCQIYGLENNIVQALKYGNKILQQKHLEFQQKTLYIATQMFNRINDLRGQKQMKKKLKNFHQFKSFVKFDGYIAIENELASVQNEHQTLKSHQIIQSDKIYLQIQAIMQKFFKESSDEKNYQQKFFMMRNLLSKLIQFNFPLKRFIEQYEKDIENYEVFLKAKFDLANNLNILIEFKDSETIQSERGIHASQAINEFLLFEKQFFMKYILGFSSIILDKKMIDQEWVKYTHFYQTIKSQVSKIVQQLHREFICKYSEHKFNISYLQETLYSKKLENHDQHKFFQSQKVTQNLKNTRAALKQSIETYLSNFDKNLLNHDFYLNIMCALRRKTIQIQSFPIHKVNSDIKQYFYFMLQKKQIYYFATEKSIGRIFLRQILSLSIEEIVIKNFQQLKSQFQNFQVTNQNITEKRLLQSINQKKYTNLTKKVKTQECLHNKAQDFLEDIYMSLWRFIKENGFLSHSNLMIEISLEIKDFLLKSVLSLKTSSKDFLSKVSEKILKSLKTRMKEYAEEQIMKEMLIMVVVITTLKIDFHLQAQSEELFELSKYLRYFKLSSKQLGRQAIYCLYAQYWSNPAVSIFPSESSQIRSVKRYVYQMTRMRQEKYFLIKLLRNFGNKSLVSGYQKYLENAVKVLRQKIFTQLPKKPIEEALNLKLQKYIRCNLDDQSIFLK